ncbi:Ribosome-associated heat shock protein implicated in the recycling of the 50S subunit (S4 paralog) [hydrothermal vent metagenome]|uniref:Ribosome-associated heat shock protein implicated in the recycling of the 50S subunit (S4 paralog) n=1 Tax=hydrothermal vent metagenome TaxID=652676 RepID=A0A3B0Y5L4_9ZZZZ
MTELEKLRVDRWLWCARFYKTRALASKEVNGGKIHVNGHRVKSSFMLKVGDQLKITKGIYELIIDVLLLQGKRGAAKVAVLMYSETEESIATRDRINELNKISGQHLESPKRKPDKRQRRELIKVRHKD